MSARMIERQSPLSATRLNIMLQSVGECVARVAILVAQSQERIARGQRDVLSFHHRTALDRSSPMDAHDNDMSALTTGQSDGAT